MRHFLSYGKCNFFLKWIIFKLRLFKISYKFWQCLAFKKDFLNVRLFVISNKLQFWIVANKHIRSHPLIYAYFCICLTFPLVYITQPRNNGKHTDRRSNGQTITNELRCNISSIDCIFIGQVWFQMLNSQK